MIKFNNILKKVTVQEIIQDLEILKQEHNFNIKPVPNELLRKYANLLKNVGIQPDDIYASIDAPAEKQEEYLLYKSKPGGGMGKGALGDLKEILKKL